MRKVIAVLLIFSLLTTGIVFADDHKDRERGDKDDKENQKGEFPALQRLVQQLIEIIQDLLARVEVLEQNDPGSGLEPRVSELEQRVADLENENNVLRNIPLDQGIQVPPQPDGIIDPTFGTLITVQPSPFILGDLLDGIINGNLIVTNLGIVPEPPAFNDEAINCNIGSSVFENDRSPGSTGVTLIYNHTKDISRVNQFQNWTAVPRGNMSCVPTLSGSALEFWNRTLPSLTRGQSLFNVSDELHRLMKTNETTGTNVVSFFNGITKWINESGYAKNMTITIRGVFVNQNVSLIRNGVNVTGIAGTGDIFNPLDIHAVLEEFVTKNEYVMLAIEVPGGFHVVAIHSIDSTPNANGNYDVALVDPATGEIIETEIEPNGDICTRYNALGSCEATTTLQGIFSISLKD